MERPDQAVYPRVELGKGYSLVAADKRLLIGMEKGISVYNICERSSLVTAQFPQNEFMGHVFLLTSKLRQAVIDIPDAERLKDFLWAPERKAFNRLSRADLRFCQFFHSQCF